MADSYNPDNAGEGGYVAVSRCGCTRGWTAELDEDGLNDIRSWLSQGCRIDPLVSGQKFTREMCPAHKEVA